MRLNAHADSPRPAAPTGQVSVDLSAIADNVRTLRARSAAPHFMAVVKDSAYGRGLVDVARTALSAGADWLGTAQLHEAIALRRAGITRLGRPAVVHLELDGLSRGGARAEDWPELVAAVSVRDTAVLFGDPGTAAASADDWGAAIGSHGDELINRMAPRLPRTYKCPDYQEAGGPRGA